jgi:Domain of unknown function (DUF4384)
MNRNRNRLTILAALLLLTASAASAERASVVEKIREVPDARQVDVEIWTDRGDDACYCNGEPIEIYFRTNIDAWVAIYDLDTRGEIHRLFPARQGADHFVRGGEVHRVPARFGTHFEVEGPAGWETLRAVASTDRLAVLEDYGDFAPAHYRPARQPALRGGASLNKIREVPNHPPQAPAVAVAEARHYVRDGARCRPELPWWLRR